ncbi:AGAP007910-PA [Anopheles gambiae str. PEST]|uniref:AGAP007910-PA n=1 Tax=Anopheles gambiae TaxID=7165 RepID=Q5TQ51_ANOGA|nr:AGAP007910-PA [Anopheles gambiae str. PEST]
MKRVLDVEYKNVPVGKSRDKTIRSRNKRKCKRKKNARTIKRFWQAKEGTVHHHSTAQHHYDPRHPAAAMMRRLPATNPCSDIRLKHAQNMWIRAYHRVVKWHTKHQTNYWKQCAQQLRAENDRLKRSVLAAGGSTAREAADTTEGCGERHQRSRQRTTAEEEERDELDEEFLAFMEVSARHRLEHRRQKNESVH